MRKSQRGPVERGDLAIPPPAHQCPMHQPCFSTEVCHGREVGLHQSDKVGLLVLIVELAVGEPGGGISALSGSKDEERSHRPS